MTCSVLQIAVGPHITGILVPGRHSSSATVTTTPSQVIFLVNSLSTCTAGSVQIRPISTQTQSARPAGEPLELSSHKSWPINSKSAAQQHYDSSAKKDIPEEGRQEDICGAYKKSKDNGSSKEEALFSLAAQWPHDRHSLTGRS
ncbi:unnamed protein product [Protopolystoma xenopodis]|uniref:Uncharacterized protein n=1 Tax=Protopolystoma xenopodis TaxID=117903 RepID=A0A3S5CMW8_9PLAT|nr:unnamed protein product [Protopolystoma xenopodis]